MAKSLKTLIAESKARTKKLENRLPLKLGKTIMRSHKLVITNANGNPVTYTSTAKATRGKKMTRKRTINDLNEFNDHFKVVPATENGLHTVYLIKLGLDVMKMHGATTDGDFIRVDRQIKHDYNAVHANDSTDDNSNDDNDNQDDSNGSQDNPDNFGESDEDLDDQNGSDDKP